jgi:hypothetical protein
MSEVSFDRVSAGDTLPPFTLLVSASVIVAGATASGDFEVVHHDVKAAQARYPGYLHEHPDQQRLRAALRQ